MKRSFVSVSKVGKYFWYEIRRETFMDTSGWYQLKMNKVGMDSVKGRRNTCGC